MTIAEVVMRHLKAYTSATGRMVRVVSLNGAPLYVVPNASEAIDLRHQGFSPVWTEKTLASRVSTPLA
jgi:hypothetical protein